MTFTLLRYTAISISCVFLYACNDKGYDCVCVNTINGEQVAEYKLETSDKSAATFDCRQKQLQFSGPDIETVDCNIKESE